MTACPYCRQPLKGDLALPRMSGRQQRIYEAVVKAGNKGIETERLVKVIDSNGRGAGIVLRVQVHELNKKLQSVKQRIKGAGGYYWLVNVG